MIREYRRNDLDAIMQIWLNTNIHTHSFIPEEYWINHFGMVKQMLPQAEVYVFVNDTTGQMEGFIGLTEHYISGIFVRDEVQSKGIGKQLLDYAKSIKSHLMLDVYQKNIRAVRFYQREHFRIQSDNVDKTTSEKEFVMTWCRATS